LLSLDVGSGFDPAFFGRHNERPPVALVLVGKLIYVNAAPILELSSKSGILRGHHFERC
jgi:hypothetical protein